MRKSLTLLAAMFGVVGLAQPAAAQDLNTATFGGTTIWVGGGVQFLSLPDIRFTGRGTPGNFRKEKNLEGDFWDFGGATGAGIETALGFWGNARVTGAIKGFWSGVDTDDSRNCRGPACNVVDPTGFLEIISPTLLTKTDREADYWGGQVEFKFARAEPVHIRPDLYRNDYFIVGADVRGIDQDNTLRGHFGGTPIFSYKETLDTTYYGAYIGFGGEYSLGFLGAAGVGTVLDRLGLRSFIAARAGLYSAETDYHGRFATPVLPAVGGPVGPFNSALSSSDDELAFIGSISFETRKPIGRRSSLSLWTDYEFISSVPKLHYADGAGRPTRIEDDSVFASRTMLRLNIGLGSDQLYEEPLR
ncbi:MAG: hypothetical protein ACOYB4_02015 [Methyloceanibacter sp.]